MHVDGIYVGTLWFFWNYFRTYLRGPITRVKNVRLHQRFISLTLWKCYQNNKLVCFFGVNFWSEKSTHLPTQLFLIGVSCEEAAVKDVSSDSSWNGVSCSAQVRPSRPGCQELHVRHWTGLSSLSILVTCTLRSFPHIQITAFFVSL